MDLRKRYWQWVMLLLISMIWGTSFILMKKGLRSFDPVQVASLRIFIAWLIFFPMALLRLSRIKRDHLVPLIIVGIIGNFFPAYLFTLAQTHIESSIAGILNSLTPLFALIIGLMFFRSRVLLVNILGILLGLAGAVGLIYDNSADILHQSNLYGLFVILATLFYGISVNFIKYKLSDLDGVTIAAAAFSIIGPLAGIVLLFRGLPNIFLDKEAMINLGYITLLALFSSVLAVVLFNILIKYTTAIFAASVTYIIPVFAILWGITDGEKITVDQILWIFVIFIGVYLVNKEKLIKV